MNCRICSSPARPFGNGMLLGKYDVSYYRCVRCGFVQTEDPYWLDEAYSDAITGSDIGLVSRNVAVSRLVKTLIALFFDADGRFLDYGGGYGLMVRMMRDAGFDFYLHDKHCQNLFAGCLDVQDLDGGGQRFEVVTAVDVVEHLTDPMTEMGRMAKVSDNVLLTTELVPAGHPGPGEWWYYGMDHGQHISFFTREALRFVAAKFRMGLYSHNGFHLLTRKKLSPLLFRLASGAMAGRLVNLVYRRESLLQADWLKTIAKK